MYTSDIMLEIGLTIITHVNFKKYRAKQINQKPTTAASKQHSNTQQKTKQDTPTTQPAKLESHIQNRPEQTKPSALSLELESDAQERSMHNRSWKATLTSKPSTFMNLAKITIDAHLAQVRRCTNC